MQKKQTLIDGIVKFTEAILTCVAAEWMDRFFEDSSEKTKPVKDPYFL